MNVKGKYNISDFIKFDFNIGFNCFFCLDYKNLKLFYYFW